MSQTHNANMGKDLIFKEIYINHFKKVESFAHKYLQNTEDAKGVAQEVFLSVWENMDKLWEGRDIVPFLFVMTKFKCLNVIRKQTRGAAYVKYKNAHTHDSLVCAALESEALDRLLSKEVSNLVQKAFEKMPAPVKETFELSRNKDLKYHQIAQEQNISVKAVEYRMSCALKVLREHLKDYLICLALMISKFM